jgi:hypothetical protein
MMLKYARQDEGRNDQCTRAWMGVQFISRALGGSSNHIGAEQGYELDAIDW